MKQLTCPICGYSSERFDDYVGEYYILGELKDHFTKNAICPKCRSDMRHRFIYKFLEDKTNFNSTVLKLLHFAPEKWLAEKIVNKNNIEYIPADINPEKLDFINAVYVDATSICYGDEVFDAIISVHVLEHIQNDMTAIHEMYRVLKKGGWAVIAVPTIGERTHEDKTLTSGERERMYGISDHFRLYGTDLIQKMESAGFAAELYEFSDLGDSYIDLNTQSPHIDSDRYIFYCKKNSSTRNDGVENEHVDNCIYQNGSEKNKYLPPKLCIVTVTYNAENELCRTIDSILGQTYKDYELIIIDGGSTDCTLDLIRRYEDKIDYWISEKDNGIYDAMNKALVAAKGEYVQFLNAGDYYIDQYTLKNVFTNITDSPTLIYGDIRILRTGGKIIYQKASEFTLDNLIKKGTSVLCHQAMFVKRERAPIYNTKYPYKGELNWYLDLAKLEGFTYVKCEIPIVFYALGGYGYNNYLRNRLDWLRVIYNRYGVMTILKSGLIIFLLKNSINRYPILSKAHRMIRKARKSIRLLKSIIKKI